MHYPPPPQHQPARRPRSLGRKIGMYGCLPIAVLFGGLIGLGAIVGNDTDDSTSSSKSSGTVSPAASSPAPDPTKKTPAPDKPTKASPTKTETPGLSKRDITKMSVNLVWDSYSNARRDLLCIGVEANGPGWFADQLTSDNLDREYAGQLIEEKCANR